MMDQENTDQFPDPDGSGLNHSGSKEGSDTEQVPNETPPIPLVDIPPVPIDEPPADDEPAPIDEPEPGPERIA